MLWKMIDSESKPKVRKKLPTHALTKSTRIRKNIIEKKKEEKQIPKYRE
jgi:hypothetical protein